MMMKIYILRAAMCAVLFFLFGCGQDRKDAAANPYPDPAKDPVLEKPIEGFSLYRFPVFPVRLQYPSNWEKREESIGVAFLLPEREPASDVIEGLTVLVDEMRGIEMSFAEYSKMVTEDLKKRTTGFKLIQSQDITLSGAPAHRIIYEGIFNDLSMRYLSLYCLKDGLLATVGFSATGPRFEKYIPLVENVIGSFEFIPSPPVEK